MESKHESSKANAEVGSQVERCVMQKYKFKKTSCSQCGRSFGPGDCGYSHCEDHERTEFTFWYEDADGVPCQEKIITTHRNAKQMYDSGDYSLPMIHAA